jgi:hypothetical protein
MSKQHVDNDKVFQTQQHVMFLHNELLNSDCLFSRLKKESQYQNYTMLGL